MGCVVGEWVSQDQFVFGFMLTEMMHCTVRGNPNIRVQDVAGLSWPLTPKFNTTTQPFLKLDMQHRAYGHGQKNKETQHMTFL